MTSQLKKTFSLFLLAICILTACERESVSEDLEVSEIGLKETNEEEGCQQIGLQFAFDLGTMHADDPGATMIPIGKSYYLYLTPTPPYHLGKDCVCRIKYYDVAFNHLPPAADIQVTDMGGNPINFIGPQQMGSFQTLEIHATSLTTEVLIGFSPNVVPKPLLVTAGGFCIVDNISGPRIEAPLTSAYEEVGQHPISGLPINNIFLPLSVMSYQLP